MFAVAQRNDPASEIIKRLNELGLKPAWLATRIEESKQNVSHWLTGKNSPTDPGIWDRMLAAIPKFELDEPKIPVGFKTAQIPLAGDVPAGDWGDPLASEDFVEIDAKYEHRKRFAATVVGASCYPALMQGDLTIWQADMNPPYGTIVIAQRKGDHGCTVKELRFDDARGRTVLHPINESYAEPEDGDGWGVIARLVAVIRQTDGPERTW